MCCTRLTENTGSKKVAKNRHLHTIAQLCRAISSQLRHVSTNGKKTCSAAICPRDVLTIWWTSAHWRLRSVRYFGAPHHISTGFASCSLYNTRAKLATAFTWWQPFLQPLPALLCPALQSLPILLTLTSSNHRHHRFQPCFSHHTIPPILFAPSDFKVDWLAEN